MEAAGGLAVSTEQGKEPFLLIRRGRCFQTALRPALLGVPLATPHADVERCCLGSGRNHSVSGL